MKTGAKFATATDQGRYFIGLGANLPSRHGPALATLIAALGALEAMDIKILARSPWFESEPVPSSAQDWFINGVIVAFTSETPHKLLNILHKIELDFGRIRTVANAPRPLDLDLLAAVDGAAAEPRAGWSAGTDLSGRALVLPHPRMAERAFVLRPMAAIAPDWVHPGTGRSVASLAAELPERPMVRLLGG